MTKLKYIYKIDLFDCFRPVKKGPQPVIYNKARTGRTLVYSDLKTFCIIFNTRGK